MRLLILSDLHLEFWGDQPMGIDLTVSQPDVVILAGDIHTGTGAIPWAARMFPDAQVLYVHGNHEGYGEKLDQVRKELKAASALTPGVHFLDSAELVMGDVRFLGVTLWTDFRLGGDDARAEAMFVAQQRLNDYRVIRLASQGYRTLRAADTARWHDEQRNWLTRKLDTPFAGTTVVITHMAPSERSIPDRYKESVLSAAFASHLDALVAKADLWVHGHLHDTFDYRIGKCRVVCNPRGYPRDGRPENEGFDPNFTVEVGWATCPA